MITNEKYVIKSEKTASRIIDNEAMILTPEDSTLHILNSVGTKIWEHLDEKRRIKDIISIIYEEFDVDYKKAENDVIEFIEKLFERGMVVFAESPHKEVK